MAKVHYVVVEHNGGWAYRLGDAYSETFESRQDAHDAAERAAAEQKIPDEDTIIQYQDAEGHWKTEAARGDDRPDADVEDEAQKR